MVKLSVIIVAYKNMEQLKLCLTSIPAEPWLEVIVVDNTHHNRGFGAGCNVGLTLAQGKYVMFLTTETWQYWTSIAGALGLTTAVYNELFHQKKKAAVIAFFAGLGAVVTSPAAVIINIVGMVSWIMIDMVNMSRCRSLLVKAWVLIIAVYLVTL